MATINLGRVGYVHKGAYSHAATYEKYDVVFYNHGSYLYIGESASGHGPMDKAYWQAMLDPAEMNAATNTARAAADNIYQRLASFTAPFSVTGNPVSCYPVADYPLDAIIHLVPVQAGEGNPAPDNVRAISPVRKFNVRNREQEIPVHLENPVYGGDYHWKALKITGKAKYKELTGNEGWYLNQNGNTSYFVHHLEPSEIGVDHKAYMSHYTHLDTMAYGVPGTNVFRCWNTKGVFRVGIRPDLSAYNVSDHDGSVAKWKEYLSAQAAAGTPVQIVYFVQNGEEEAVSSFGDIISYRGENIISTDNGTITVSGPLDPAWQNAQQDERITDLEESAIGGGGGYVLPPATPETLGGVIVGDGLQVDADGRVSVEQAPEPEKFADIVLEKETAEVTIDFPRRAKVVKIFVYPPAEMSRNMRVYIGIPEAQGLELPHVNPITAAMDIPQNSNIDGYPNRYSCDIICNDGIPTVYWGLRPKEYATYSLQEVLNKAIKVPANGISSVKIQTIVEGLDLLPDTRIVVWG